jgi:RNA 3'-terminal phosphate cyclase (ATP)
MDFLKINGGHGEGGGQIIRSAIALSCITKQQISGLRPQHLTAITILQKIANAKVIGAEIGSTELKFIPGDIENLDLEADVRTAGSIPLILQVLIPVVALSQKKLSLKIKGGTDVLWSPSIDYTQHVLREAYSRMGIKFSFELCKRGYYPKGDGEINLQINPSNIKSISFSKRKTNDVKLICSFSKLANEEIENKVKEILYNKKTCEFDLDIDKFIQSYSIDDNLADMIVVPASLANGKTIFQVKEITKHLETNLFVTSKITGCKYGIGKTSNGFDVIIEGISNPSIK